MTRLMIGAVSVDEGKRFCADIGIGKAWVVYSDSNEGEANHYRGVYDGHELAYSHGEVCEVVSTDNRRAEVTLKNIGEDYTFTISAIQFMEDFLQ